MEQIVESFNLFVDSSRSSQAGSTGDNFKLSLANDIIECGKGQLIRVSLTDFSMEKPFTDINQLNNFGKINTGTHTIQFGGIEPASYFGGLGLYPANYFYHEDGLDHINLPNLTDLATAFGEALKNAYNTFSPPLAGHLTVDTATVGKDNRIKLLIKFTADTPSDFNIQLNSDLHILLGGTYSDTTFDSLTVTKLASNDGFQIESKYPCARHSSHHIYLRTNLSNTGIETAGFASENRNPTTDTEHSSILGRIPLQDEVIYFESSNREYFLNLRQKNISFMRLYLTDERNRFLPLFAGQNAQGGTCRFTCTLRIDIVQVLSPNEFVTPPYEPGIPPRFTSNFLEKLDFGAPEKTFR